MTMSPASSTPSIRIYDSASLHRYPLPHHRRPSFPTPSGAMAIPRAREEVPPPLPPPRYIGELSEGQDPGWQWGNSNDAGFGRRVEIKPGSSLLGGAAGSRPVHVRTLETSGDSGERGFGFPPRESSSLSSRSFDDMSSLDDQEQHSDEDRNGQTRPKLANHSERQLGQKALESSSHAYDKQLLSKIGGPNTPTRTTAPPLLSASAQESATTTHTSFSKLNGQLKPLSVPDHLHPSLDSPISRWPPSGAISPGFSGFRSPVFDPGSADFHQRRFGSISTPGALDDTASQHHRGSYDHSMFLEAEFGVEEGGMRDLNINDRSPSGSEESQMGPKAGLKRRASSPPSEAAREDRPTASGGNTDLYHRRSAQMLVSRNSPVSRFHANQGSLSSASSLSQRTASIASSYGLSTASSVTSYSGEVQRLSPSALSPSAEAELGPVSPYAASRSLNPSPRGSLSRPHHQRGLSENEQAQIRKMSTDSVLHSRQSSVSSRLPGAYICECCPKKPKKFDSEEELRIHELEKQYTCQYCPNRFKNKNEAERHQNSLHLRRHSWSCAALAGVRAAFHPSPTHSTVADICGYCGEEFPNPANWDVRSEHLNHVHKFGECNQAKKFFRADHFRQHLKHSHAGTSGKWTNMLENACMKDEPPPKDRVGSVGSIAVSSAMGSLAPKPGVIDEEHDES
ncbi:uncharacterized protein BDR25DRAFT_133071 [Lindgomyces ingoldianus]|uniref:Uncharacterized protein n=1 Tax=Lindgomyces ingoldianus TaxID=673940 RepID=A0ACB6Q6S8_9PLEO|nr:uncharacterized protein BDR25DRAFT_133071 [Lindgomyces ingoldianus]KAF2462528.1 hypothetical protein BDR25DRAFT_133071 [Lindgomyces ingoldianus]